MKREIVSIAIMLMLFVSMFLSLPLVSAAYTVENPFMPPDPDDCEPLCAMKTRGPGYYTGYFYIPHLLTDLLKVELLFDNPDLMGDQTGGTSPYGSSIAYPDGVVDMFDVVFETSRYRAREGDVNWDYMADITIAFMEIDICDVCSVTTNYGKSGTYITDLEGVTILFDTGEEITPDNGFVTIPQDATSFTVKQNGNPIGAMVSFWGPATPPIAYSTTFEFTVPEDGDNEVWYYVLAKLYVPEELFGDDFTFVADYVDDWVINVKIDRQLKYEGSTSDPPCQPLNVTLNNLNQGYHLLEFVFAEEWVGGKIHFCVTTADGDYAWLTRFRVYVPNYSDTPYEYTVRTTTYFPGDTFFLGGYADDFVDDVYVDVGKIWDDWQWDMGSYGTMYAWADGFMYPLGWRYDSHLITFTFGETIASGLLDFQYVSWTHQQEKMGEPRFYCKAENPVVLFEPLRIDCNEIYGGSKWDAEAGTSCRSISTTYEMTVYLPPDAQDPNGHSATTRFTISLLYLDYESPKGTITDFGITFNMTHLGRTNTTQSPLDVGFEIPSSGDFGIHVYAPEQALIIRHLEYSEGRSFVDDNFVVNLASDVGYVIFAGLVSGTMEFGAAALALIAGGRTLATMAKYTNGQQLPQSGEIGSDPSYRRLWTNGYSFIPEWEPPPHIAKRGSRSDILFLQTKSTNGMHCGAMKIVVVCKLWFTDWGMYPIGVSYTVKTTTTFIVPYFVKN